MSTENRSPLAGLDDCGCCEGLGPRTPEDVRNRPGLSAIDYRVGRYATFKDTLLARLTSADLPALAALRTRDRDDFTIALLDSWAIVGDVLTFYQERIANEAFLRTATERRSLLELARLIGYQLGPGVSAGSHLAFRLEQAPGAPALAPATVEIAAGTKVQSLPGQDETPQTFETTEAVEGRVAWNAMRPQLTAVQQVVAGQTELYLAGIETGLKVGDVLLFVGAERTDDTTSDRWDVRVLQAVEADEATDRTRVRWATGLAQGGQQIVETDLEVHALRQRASLFGHNAPDPSTLNLPSGAPVTAGEWNNYTLAGDDVDLDAVYPKVVAGSWLALTAGTTTELFRVQSVSERTRRNFALNSKVTRADLDATPDATTFTLPDTAVFAVSEELDLAEVPLAPTLYGQSLTLADRVEGLEPGRLLAISGSRLRLRLDGDATGLQLVLEDGTAVDLDPEDALELVATPVLVFIPGVWEQALTPEELAEVLGRTLIEILITRLFFPAFNVRWTLRDRDGREGELLALEQVEIVGAEKDAERVSEIAAIDDDKDAVTHDRDRTTLALEEPLAHIYDRDTVEINANVAPANHGETVSEVLGNGDASQTYQTFALQQTPLTHISAATPSGSLSTLRVRVNEVLWHEVPTLYGRGPDERVFVTRRTDEGVTVVQFGDGVTGARLPTGQDNVRAVYRKGIGTDGLLDAERLTQLMSRPLGLKEVTNPRPSTGGADPETRDEARANAPLTVLTLGRAVSLQDYEDFARGFAAVAKAHAGFVYDGAEESLVITVAGPDGAAVDEDSETHEDLLAALADAGDPFTRFTVVTYRPATFRLAAKLRLDPDVLAESVVAQVDAALRAAFDFDVRAFGQPVTLAEAIAVVHSVPGVVAVDIDALYRGATSALESRILAAGPELDSDGTPLGAELLTLDPAPLDNLEVLP